MSGERIRYEHWITRAMLRAEPDTLFVFGDNLQRRGLGGQAKEMRGEPNAVGIPTKREPSMTPRAFLHNDDLATWLDESAEDFARIEAHLRRGGQVVFPADGIGTGLAQLRERAPWVWAVLTAKLRTLEETARLTLPQTPNQETNDAGE